MTDCQWVAQHLDEYELGQLGTEDCARIEAHLTGCEGCRELQARARRADDAIRAALKWAEPDAGFAAGIAGTARGARRWWVSAAAAAALLCIALLWASRGQHLTGTTLIAGKLSDASGTPAERIEAGRRYQATEDAALDLDEEATFLIARATQFACAPDPKDKALAMSLFSGAVVAEIKPRREQLAVELGSSVARTARGEFYGRRVVSERAADGWGLLRPAWAAPAEKVQLHVFAGAVELDVRNQKLRLPEGESCIVSDGAQPVTTQALRDRIKQLQRTVSDGDVALSQLYEKLCAHYSKRLAELRGEAGPHELAYRQERIALLENLLADHTKAFETLQAKKPDIPDLKAAQAALGHLDDLRREAESVRERLARLLADRPASSEQGAEQAP